NYKIKVNDEAESKEAQDLFFELGCEWRDSKKDISNLDAVYIYADDEILTFGFNEFNFRGSANTELTLPQLRDLVVLHRNDVKDATHEAACGTYLFLDSSGDWHFFHKHEAVFYTIDGDISTFVDMPITLIKEQTQQPTEIEQGLISGADALRALADGKDVEYWCENDPSIQKRWTPIKALNEYRLSYFLENKPRFEFRLKPRTITLNLEIPAPFEPKEGEEFFILAPLSVTGYTKVQGITTQALLDEYVKLGAWRTEEQVKQVVAALRGGIKA
ncbi:MULTISPECIES: hypothetical protein, partial [unclassified Acinetobacter]|uniref:hypothetical protein n=1 Tax=unclassified Acinetobacter TaxID=196816 RepID=UPI00148EF8BC